MTTLEMYFCTLIQDVFILCSKMLEVIYIVKIVTKQKSFIKVKQAC